MKQSVKDLGWMYHILPVKRASCPKLYPPLSTIPELGLVLDESCVEERKSVFKSTDTPYQTLCKMGGVHGLLYHKENDIVKKPPVPYPRCEWFYLDDQEPENYKKRECSSTKYEFKVPDYMAQSVVKQKPFICVDPIPVIEQERVKTKNIRKKLQVPRPGYSEYTIKPVKLTYAQKDYGRPHKVQFPKFSISNERESTKNVIENYYVRDYAKYRKQWNEIKYTETLRGEVNRRKDYKKMSKDLKTKLFHANQNRLNGVFPFL